MVQIKTKGYTSLKKFLNWIYYTENFIKFVKGFSSKFEEIKVTEYLENNFTIEVKKSFEYSIGSLFGIIEDLVCYI